MLDLDSPEHTKIRGLVSHGFTPRSVSALEPRIRETVKSCWATLRAGAL